MIDNKFSETDTKTQVLDSNNISKTIPIISKSILILLSNKKSEITLSLQ